jgi:hypothetical protein
MSSELRNVFLSLFTAFVFPISGLLIAFALISLANGGIFLGVSFLILSGLGIYFFTKLSKRKSDLPAKPLSFIRGIIFCLAIYLVVKQFYG